MASYSGGNYCARWHDLLPQHAVGNPLGEEAAELREHLESCAACRRELAALEEALALLPLGLPEEVPSAGVKERLMEQVRAEASGVPWGVVVPIHGPGATGRTRTQGAPGTQGQQAGPPAGARRRGVGTWLALAAALSATVGASVVAVREHGRLQAASRELSRVRAEGVARSDASAARLKALEERAAVLSARGLQVVSLRTPGPRPEDEGSAGRIFWDQDRQVWFLVAFRLPPPPPDKDYELWFLVKPEKERAPAPEQDRGKEREPAEGEVGPQPVAAGLLAQGWGGQIEAEVRVPRDIGEIAAAAVTLERKGGVDKPTSDPLLIGEI